MQPAMAGNLSHGTLNDFKQVKMLYPVFADYRESLNRLKLDCDRRKISKIW